MHINLYYDVFLVPPVNLVKAKKQQVERVRFVKKISMSCLLVPGQTYCMQYDPVSGSPDPCSFTIKDSGAFEANSKQIPYMVVVDDDWLAFDSWYKHEIGMEEAQLPFDELLELWRTEDQLELSRVKQRFSSLGWIAVHWSTLDNPQPPGSEPDLDRKDY